MSDKLIIFDISSEYGHFRKFNTTSSPLTYSIPTPTALSGIIGAILGIEREVSPGKFENGGKNIYHLMHDLSFGVQLLNPVKKVNIGFNLLDTEKKAESFFNIRNRTQIEYELLKNPKFRIFLSCQNRELFNEINQRLKETRHHFTPYLGLSQFTAKIEYQGETPFTRKENSAGGYIELLTAVNLNKTKADNPVRFDKVARYSADTMPILMNQERIVQNFAEVLIEANGKPVWAKVEEWINVEGRGKVTFLS